MPGAWYHLNPTDRIKFSQKAREVFRRALLTAYLKHPDEPFTATDEDLANLCGVPRYTTKRYIKFWKDRGLLTTTNRRHLHPAFGWCNQRTINIDPTHVLIARTQLETHGKVL